MILITGANGFIGSALCNEAISKGLSVRCATRELWHCQEVMENVVVGDINGGTDWTAALVGIDVVVHTAARVHVMHDTANDPLAVFRDVNLFGTLNLARQAAQSGVKRLVFFSSIKVNGESTQTGSHFSADDKPAPQDAYAISKWEAEDALLALATETGMEVVVIRPPLVYGPGVKANFNGMMRWLSMGLPLPLGAIENKRSLVALDNLVSLIMTCLTHPQAANQIFLVSDGEDVSTTELLRRTAAAMGCPARLFPVPMKALELVANLLGREGLAQRLFGNLQVDTSKARQLLDWSPHVSLDEGLWRTAQAFSHEKTR